MSKTIVTSDQHLGYKNSNSEDFKDFLNYIITKRDDIQSLILLGDLVDMWRRDASGIFLEFSEVIDQLLNIRDSKKIQVYIVAGNHDYHILNLKDRSYKFKFYKQLPEISNPLGAIPTIYPGLPSHDSKEYIFQHGWEFDIAQQKPIMELMCHSMSDEIGNTESSIYDIFTKIASGLDDEIKNFINKLHHDKGIVNHLLLPPEKRLGPTHDVERKAYSTVKDTHNQVLIFGHTHRPFISSDHKLVNSGSWVKDAETNNTFIEIDEDDIKLFQFKGKDTDPKDITESLTWNLSTV